MLPRVILTKQREFGYLSTIKNCEISDGQLKSLLADAEAERDRSKRESDSCRAELMILRDRLQVLQHHGEEVDFKMMSQNQVNVKLKSEVDDLKVQVAQKESELQDLSSKLQKSQSDISKLQDKVVCS